MTLWGGLTIQLWKDMPLTRAASGALWTGQNNLDLLGRDYSLCSIPVAFPAGSTVTIGSKNAPWTGYTVGYFRIHLPPIAGDGTFATLKMRITLRLDCTVGGTGAAGRSVSWYLYDATSATTGTSPRTDAYAGAWPGRSTTDFQIILPTLPTGGGTRTIELRTDGGGTGAIGTHGWYGESTTGQFGAASEIEVYGA